MEFAKKDRINCLYDLYQNLLTEHQKDVISSYYQEDLSLGEIAENLQISRNAVFALIHRVESILEDYESKLHLLDKKNKINKVLENSKVLDDLKNKIEKIIEE